MRRKIAHVTTVDLTLRFLLLPQLRALRDAGFEVTAISSPGPWVRDIEAEGIRHIPWLHATREWDPSADARAFRELHAIFKRERFDLIHTHNPKPGVIGRVAARLAGVPCVVNTVHGLYATPEDKLRRRALVLAAEWVAARFSDLELYQSAEDLAWARRLQVTRAGRSVHIGNGVDIARFTPDHSAQRIRRVRAELGIGEGELVVGTVGRMVREKGYLELFEAAALVRGQMPNVRFLAVGESDGDKTDAVTPLQIERAEKDVIFSGWREDVAQLMGLMDIFVLPSWREGLPRSAVEAAATGVPLVLTDIRGCREVITDGVEGRLVPVRDPVRLAAGIMELLEDPGLRQRMGTAARRQAEERFDERRVAQTVVDESTRLLVGAGRALAARSGERPGVRRGRAADAPAIARLHRESMSTGFLPSLGDAFLVRLYRSMMRDPESVVFVAEERGQVAGFAAGVPSVRSFYRRFVRNDGVVAAFVAAPYLVRPSVLRRAIETARHPAKANGLPDAELLSIAVDASCRSEGVGGALATAVARGLADRGAAEFKVVVGADNEGANRFYERLGFRTAGRETVHSGAPSNVWVMACRS